MKKAKTNFLILFFPICLFSCGKTAKDYLNEGKGKFESKDYQGAISDCNKAIELNPNYALAYNNRGAAKVNLADFQGAIADLSKAIELDPKYAEAYSFRGAAKSELKDKYGACFDWSKAGEFGDSQAYEMIKIHCQ
jgi:Flp pilus assembly protein TadD